MLITEKLNRENVAKDLRINALESTVRKVRAACLESQTTINKMEKRAKENKQILENVQKNLKEATHTIMDLKACHTPQMDRIHTDNRTQIGALEGRRSPTQSKPVAESNARPEMEFKPLTVSKSIVPTTEKDVSKLFHWSRGDHWHPKRRDRHLGERNEHFQDPSAIEPFPNDEHHLPKRRLIQYESDVEPQSSIPRRRAAYKVAEGRAIPWKCLTCGEWFPSCNKHSEHRRRENH